MRSGRLLAACVTMLLLWMCAAASAQTQTADSLRIRATELIYEHQHDEAIKLLRQAVALAPNQSATHRSLASAVWLKMLFLRGAVTVDHYLGPFNRARVDLTKPPPELVSEFQSSITTALRLAESRVAALPPGASAKEAAQAHYAFSARPRASTPPTSHRSKAVSSQDSARPAARTTSTKKCCASTRPGRTPA